MAWGMVHAKTIRTMPRFRQRDCGAETTRQKAGQTSSFGGPTARQAQINDCTKAINVKTSGRTGPRLIAIQKSALCMQTVKTDQFVA